LLRAGPRAEGQWRWRGVTRAWYEPSAAGNTSWYEPSAAGNTSWYEPAAAGTTSWYEPEARAGVLGVVQAFRASAERRLGW